MFTRRFEYTFFEYFKNFERKMLAKPLNLGGTSGTGGGAGGPPGGFIGYLPQTRVTYDTSEIASSGTPPSGQSLLDNLNHIRYRIESLEQYGVTSVYEDDVLVASGVTILNFEGDVNVTNDGGGQVTVTVISGVPTDELVKISSNDTIASYLQSKISAGSNVNINVLNEGGNEQLEISSVATGMGDSELELIEEVVSSGDAYYLEVNSIPSTYKNLVVDYIARSTDVATHDNIGIYFNGDDTLSNYYTICWYNQTLDGEGDYTYLGEISSSGAVSDEFSHYRIVVADYANTIHRHYAQSLGTERRAADDIYEWRSHIAWENTDAIHTVRIGAGNDLVSGSLLRVWGEGVISSGEESGVVKISSNDTTANYLENKLVEGSGVSIAVLNEGGNEQLEINVNGLAGLIPNTILYANESGEVTTSGLLQYFNADTYEGDPADGYFFPHLIIGYQGEDYKEYEYWDYMPFGISNISVYTAGNSQPVTDNDYGISIVCTREESYYGNQARLAFWSAQGDLINPEALANQARAGIIEFNGWNSYWGWWQGLADITVSTDAALTGDATGRGVIDFNVDQYGLGSYTSQMKIDRYGVTTLQQLFISGWYKRGATLINTFPYTISDTQYGPNVFYLSNAAAYTVYLPTASTATNRVYTFKKITNNGYAMTIDGHDSETIDGATTYVLSAYNESVTLACNGTEWYVLNSYTP